MPPTRIAWAWRVCTAVVLLAAAPAMSAVKAAPAAALAEHDPTLIYLDNDFLGPGQSNIQSLIPALRTPGVRLLGIGVVTGDAWLAEETAHVLRFLEIAGRTDVPVFAGAQMPLIRTNAEMKTWETRYGRIPWKGAWNAPKPGRTYHPDDPALIPELVEGPPSISAAAENAASFLIRMVHEHPGEVTLITAGPLTNIALAVRLDPALPRLAREIVIEGGKLDNSIARVTGNPDYGTDFNFLFDPEAAHIVLTSPWARVTVVGDVTEPVKVTREITERVGRSGTPVARYFQAYARVGQPFWDEITVAVALDRTLVTQEIVARMDVDILPGPTYGQAQVWSDDQAPGNAEVLVHIVRAMDVPRFLSNFTSLAEK
ncbi:MAG TPA: nucleoside hydrolase [Steroidobacteraceae bacterium]|nr:nucleoside hydrolase [Steroidobacteraceae bacterium]